ncbi:MAG: protein kinase [Planctomycetes bacterium]|nr:protein kinase [Planctomycetota bacterium]
MNASTGSHSSSDDLIDAAFAEFLRRSDGPVPPDIESFLLEYPVELRPALRAAIDGDESVGRAMRAQARASVCEEGGAQERAVLDEGATRSWPDRGAAARPPAPGVGQCIAGEYELLELIGRGGMGVVYRARQRSLDRIVAVKMIATGRLADDEDIARFRAEAQAAARVDHPNIVAVYQVGEFEGHHFYAMDFVEGTDLARRRAQGAMPARRVATYLRAIADAIDAAHERGILHRDLKPANILIDADDRPLVGDFGLAKLAASARNLTTSGRAMGTPAYMPPEQAAGKWAEVARTSDVYSLGAVLYVMLTGQPPFRGSSDLDTLLAVLHQEPAPPRDVDPSVDADLATICMKCLRKQASERYPTARALVEDIDRYLRGEPIHARPRSAWSRAARWVRDIPIVAAIEGRYSVAPTRGHRRAQAGIMLAVIGLIVAIVLVARQPGRGASAPMPRRIVVAAGRSDGVYHALSRAIESRIAAETGRDVDVVATGGSMDNLTELLAGRAHLGWLQAAALHGDELCVVAPAYYEYVHVIARRDAGIARINDLAGKTVRLGDAHSGSRLTAEAVLAQYALGGAVTIRDGDWVAFAADPSSHAAIWTVGLQPQGLRAMLDSGAFVLVPVVSDGDAANRTLEPAVIPRSAYPRAIDGAAGCPTLRTPAFLVTARSTSERLVTAALAALYDSAREPGMPELIPREVAATWTFLPWHAASRAFHEHP